MDMNEYSSLVSRSELVFDIASTEMRVEDLVQLETFLHNSNTPNQDYFSPGIFEASNYGYDVNNNNINMPANYQEPQQNGIKYNLNINNLNNYMAPYAGRQQDNFSEFVNIPPVQRLSNLLNNETPLLQQQQEQQQQQQQKQELQIQQQQQQSKQQQMMKQDQMSQRKTHAQFNTQARLNNFIIDDMCTGDASQIHSPPSHGLPQSVVTTPSNKVSRTVNEPKVVLVNSSKDSNIVNFGGSAQNIIKLTAVEDVRRKAEEAREAFKVQHKETRKKRKSTGDEDEEEREEKYNRRLHLNRQSAAAARVRREVYISLLEESLTAFEVEKLTLQQSLDQMNNEVAFLRMQLQELTAQEKDTTVLKLQIQELKAKLNTRQYVNVNEKQQTFKGIMENAPAA